MAHRTQAFALVAVAAVAALVPATANATSGAAARSHSPAHAHSHAPAPAQPTGVHVARVSSSSFTVAAHPAAHAKRYRLFAASTRSDLAEAELTGDTLSTTSHLPRLTISHLRYRTSPYFYRVETVNGTKRRFALINKVGLRPAAPQHTVATSGSRAHLTWTSGAQTGYTIEQATDPSMTTDRRFYRILGRGHEFTPYGLTKGTTYYFRIRSLNNGTPSRYTKPVAAVQRSSEQSATVMTYNILEARFDGRREGSGRVAPWSRRRIAAAKLIRHANPDVIGIQEGASWAGKPRHQRQVDSLASALGETYRVAHTELRPGHKGWHRTGVYVMYKKSVYAAAGRGGHWDLGQRRWAAFQVLRNRQSGARVLFVSAHLYDPLGHTGDVIREAETKKLLQKGSALGARRHVPVVYVGDFNSDQYRHNPNGPQIAMRDAHMADAYNVAQSRTYMHYNTAETYKRVPPSTNARIDYVFAPGGVSVQSWGLAMHLRHGRFVGTIPSDHNPVVVHLAFPY